MTKFKFNHDADIVGQALGVEESFIDTIDEKYQKIAEKLQEKTTASELPNTSFVVELLYKNFNKAELSFMAAGMLLDLFRHRVLLDELGIEVEVE